MNTINELLQWLDRIQGLSAAALIFMSCIVVGYALRFVKRFPNDGIPVVVILWGAVAMLIIADPRASSMPARIWTMRNLAVGLIIGLVAWLIHNKLLSRAEDWLLSKLPNLGNTDFFKRKNGDSNEPPKT